MQSYSYLPQGSHYTLVKFVCAKQMPLPSDLAPTNLKESLFFKFL